MPGRRLVAGPRRVLAAFGVEAGRTVLEIGTGTGFYSIEAARRVGRQGRLICLDLQADMLRHARARITAAGASACFVRADACALPVRAACIDHLLLITVLGEIPDRPRALAEVRRVLRPGGRLSVSEQFPDPDFVTRQALRRELRVAGFDEERSRGWLAYTSTWRRP
jgi:ubiquinone/menaquinone biosynthesis C-methylase UbiE